MKKVFFACCMLLLATQQMEAQKLLKKLQQAMEPKPIDGFCELSATTAGTLDFLALPFGLVKFQMPKYDDYYKVTQIEYESSVSKFNRYSLEAKVKTTKPYYEYCINSCANKAVQVEDSTFYMLYNKNGQIATAFNPEVHLVSIVSNDKAFLRELKGWKLNTEPKSERAKAHLATIKTVLAEIEKGRAENKIADAQKQKEETDNKPLPGAGTANKAKLFAKHKEMAPKLLAEHLEGKGMERFVPIYAYTRYNNPEFAVIKDRQGNQRARELQTIVVCQNTEAASVKDNDYSKFHFSNKYVYFLVNTHEDGSGGSFTGKIYLNIASTPWQIGDKEDAMKYKGQ